MTESDHTLRQTRAFSRAGSGSSGRLLSIVVPCYNEEGVLRAAHQRLLAALTVIDA